MSPEEESEQELLEVLKHSDTVKIILTGVSETNYSAKNIYEYIMALKEAK